MESQEKVQDGPGVTSREMHAFLGSFRYRNGSRQLPSDDVLISDAALRKLVHDNLLSAYKRKDLEPSSASIPLIARNQKDAAGKDIPIYVAHDAGAAPADFAEVRLMHTREGKPYILANEGYYKGTPKYVREKILYSAADIAGFIHKGELSTPDDYFATLHKEMGDTPGFAAMKRRYGLLMDPMAEQAGEMEVGKPKVYIDITPIIDNNPHNKFTGAEMGSVITREDKNVIFIGKEYLSYVLASDEATEEAKGVIGHELWHIKNRDLTPAGLIRAVNTAVAREHEFLADLGGAGPLGSRNPEAAAKDYETALRKKIPAYLKEHPGSGISADHPTDNDLKTVADWHAQKYPDHSSILDSMAALRKEAALMSYYENYQRKHGHPVTNHADRVAESEWAIKQVMAYMKDRPAGTAHAEPPSVLNPEQLAAMQHVKDTLGQQNAVEASAPFAPATPAMPRDSGIRPKEPKA